MIQLIKGFKDILPGDNLLWQKIECTARKLFEDFGYREIKLPILEKSELFAKSIGESTDIVEKEMYTFEDGSKGTITLRPEATASAVRSYIQHKMYSKDPIQKLYTIGPMFRRERPQKGRYRQFYQIDAEVFGIESPYIDAQIILMLVTLFEKLSVPDIKVLINSLGCPGCRPKFQKALLDLVSSAKDELCEDCNRRISKNPLRILDCKKEGCRAAVKDAPSIIEYLCSDCEDHFEVVKRSLGKRNIAYEIDKNLVRGLDYYTRTIFEVQTTSLGAQSAVAGGGRYDGLINALGGPKQPAIGFAIGFDRLSELLAQSQEVKEPGPDLFIISPESEIERAFEWACDLNLKGVRTEMDFSGRSRKSLMKRANKINTSFVLIVDERELSEGKVILKNMNDSDQKEISVDSLVLEVTEVITG